MLCYNTGIYACVYSFVVYYIPHTYHILPPSEIDSGRFGAVFECSEGKYQFHIIG